MKYVLASTQFRTLQEKGSLPLKIASRHEGFYFRLESAEQCLSVSVFDEWGERYQLFDMEQPPSTLAWQLQEEAQQLVQQLLQVTDTTLDDWIDWISQHFDVEAAHPFQKSPKTIAFKTTKKQKWFALLLEVPYKVFGEQFAGKGWIINLKTLPEARERVVDYQAIHPAYHMNKKHWISVILDRIEDPTQLQQLLEASYELVEQA